MNDEELMIATENACGQLTRYSGMVRCEELLAVLETLTDINDDLWHDRQAAGIVEKIEEAKAGLDKLAAGLKGEGHV